MNRIISLEQLCRELSVSVATGKNWLKLGKIVPSKIEGRKAYFNKEYCKKIINDLNNDKNNYLKSRRNKKFKSGFNLYKSYISKVSKNLTGIEKLIQYFENNNIILKQNEISELIAYYSESLIKSAFGKEYNKYKYLYEEISNTNKTILKYPAIKDFKPVYEQNEDILGLLYLSLNNISSRKSLGAYFTPTDVVKKLIQNTFENYNSGTVSDPCCGSGNFILNLPENICINNIFGSDIDEFSVKIARINFALKYKICDKNFIYEHIKIQNFLTCSNKQKFDYIIGNPPWAYEFTASEKKLLQKKFKTAQTSAVESYDVITEKAFQKLNNNATLSFVLPEAVLNVKSHKTLREIIAKKSTVKYIEYLGETFDGVQCPSVILRILYNNKPFNSKGLQIKTKNKTFTINTNREITPEIFDFNCNDDEYKLLKKIENIPNKVTLKDNAVFALGIVTGNNEKYLSKTQKNDYETILKGTDIEKFRIKIPKNYIVFKPDSFQQCAPQSVFRAKEKLIYKFISKKLVFAYDDKQTLTLNSCNILIPKIKGLDIKYILAILNSDIAQFYFEKKFNSVKVLRSHLEQIPIPYVDNKIQKPIIDLVNKIMSQNNNNLITELNLKIRDLY